MKELLDIVKVKPYANYHLLLEFENGEKRLVDMNSIIEKRPFNRLKGSIFRRHELNMELLFGQVISILHLRLSMIGR